MNGTFFARMLFSVMVACMLVGFIAVAQDKPADKPKEEQKTEMAAPAKETAKPAKHHTKAMKKKATKSKAMKKKAMEEKKAEAPKN